MCVSGTHRPVSVYRDGSVSGRGVLCTADVKREVTRHILEKPNKTKKVRKKAGVGGSSRNTEGKGELFKTRKQILSKALKVNLRIFEWNGLNSENTAKTFKHVKHEM